MLIMKLELTQAPGHRERLTWRTRPGDKPAVHGWRPFASPEARPLVSCLGLKVSLGQLLQHCFLKFCLSEQFLHLQILFLQVLQLFRVLSFQIAELVVPPVVGGLGQVDVS